MGILTAQQALSLYGSGNPFNSAPALRFSNYSAYIDGSLVRLLDWRQPSPQALLADRAMRGFISSPAFSCVAAKAAISSGGYRFGYYPGFGDPRTTQGLARDLAAFAAERASMRVPYATFVATFNQTGVESERGFERHLWRLLQRLADLGSPHYPWDETVSNDAADSNFAFSFGGEAFFVVGMHPNSSRLSRRFFLPAVAFNAHRQFVDARRNGRYGRIQRLVREQEFILQGSINPELREFGTRSEARQYSGRATEQSWRCPFRSQS
jgi:FPC/CPF motif-containing protein YcgG